MSISNPPNNDQIEVTLFGPGYGECSLIHLGNNNWIVIDSCIDSNTGQPAAISYLNYLGVNPENIQLVIATHWHDDHIKGLSDTLKLATNALFCCSSALSTNEFVATVLGYEHRNVIKAGPGVREIFEIFKIIEERNLEPVRAYTDRLVYHLPGNASGHDLACKVWTLSPSDRQVSRFLNELTLLMPEVKETKSRVVPQTPNSMSVVTFVEIGEISILLGGDLEETGDPNTGWSVILSSNIQFKKNTSIFKVPHHGSINAHNHDIWHKILIDSPLAILTPYNRGRTKRPSTTDVSRICQYTSNGYATSKIKSIHTKKKRSSAVEKTIKDTVGKIRQSEVATGAIRLRNGGINDPSRWAVELFNNACPVNQIYS
jgi:hypothetical protein